MLARKRIKVASYITNEQLNDFLSFIQLANTKLETIKKEKL